MKKIILLALTALMMVGCTRNVAADYLRVRTNNEFTVVEKSKSVNDFCFLYKVVEIDSKICYNYKDTANFNVGDTLVVTVKKK